MATADDNTTPRISGYQIARLLRHGGMADVYLGTQLSLARPVAIKVLAAQRTQGEETVARFEHEARTIARLDHPHIVSIYDVGSTEDGRLYYTMPYLPRGDLDDRKVDEAGVVAILRALCSALGYAHDHGIIHRDVKPGNILFDQRDRPLLADFGIALTTRDSARVTREGSTIGSNGYMSPEQARGLPLDGRADLYSLGVVAYELLSGDLPFHGPDTLSMALAHVEEPVPRLSPQRRRWQAFIDKAMAKNPADRFASAAQMAAALDAIEASVDSRGAAAQDGSAASARPWLAPILAGALVFLGVAILTTAFLRQRSVVSAAQPESRAAGIATTPGVSADRGAASVIEDKAAAPPSPTAAQTLIEPAVSALASSSESGPESRSEFASAAPAESSKAAGEPNEKTLEPLAATGARDRQGPLLASVPALRAGTQAFELARFEVTRGEYAAFVKATGRAASACREPLKPLSRLKNLSWRSPGFAQDDRHPVVCVSWLDATAYAAWLSRITHADYRLPTRAEWLQAARGIGGGGACEQGNLAGHRVLPFLSRGGCKNAAEHTVPVGRFKPSAFGIYDLAGNVSEWTLNCNSGAPDYNGHCSDHWYIGTSWRESADANPLMIGDADADVGYTTVGIRLLRKASVAQAAAKSGGPAKQ